MNAEDLALTCVDCHMVREAGNTYQHVDDAGGVTWPLCESCWRYREYSLGRKSQIP